MILIDILLSKNKSYDAKRSFSLIILHMAIKISVKIIKMTFLPYRATLHLASCPWNLVLIAHIYPADENTVNFSENCYISVTSCFLSHKHMSIQAVCAHVSFLPIFFLSSIFTQASLCQTIGCPGTSLFSPLAVDVSFQVFWIWIFVLQENQPLLLCLSPLCACCPCLSLFVYFLLYYSVLQLCLLCACLCSLCCFQVSCWRGGRVA